MDDEAELKRLDQDILRAHARKDGTCLARLYYRAAVLMTAAGTLDAACFYFTQAYVYALEVGEGETAAQALEQLRLAGRDC